jgi:hypothetical protein
MTIITENEPSIMSHLSMTEQACYREKAGADATYNALPINVGTVGHIDHGETDPNGLDAHVGTKGSIKYTRFGFLEVDDGKARYTDAMFRHWFKECTGEEYDMIDDHGKPGTEELHAACVAWNALARLEFILMEKENSDSENIPTLGDLLSETLITDEDVRC